MKKKYLQRVNGFSNAFKKDIFDTLVRIDKKDPGKAYPLRIYNSVKKRWKYVHRYKITLTLQYFEYMGLVTCELESLEDYKKRKHIPGLYAKGLRRKYYKVNTKKPSESMGNEPVQYEKLSYHDLGIEENSMEYPV